MSVSSGGAESSSSREVDFLDLCTSNVRIVEDLAKGESLLNRRQCQDLASKLSQTVGNIREVVSHSGASPTLFRPALTNLYRYLEKAKLLVTNCAKEDWCAAAVFQCQNENAFRVILLEVGLCYNAIYELAKSHRKERNDLPADLRQSPVFDPTTDADVLEDKLDLQKRLDELASRDSNLRGLDYWIPGRAARRPSLAKYLLDKMHCTSLQPQASILGSYNPVLWRKASEPSGTWGSSRFLGAGSGANGVCSTTWLGIPCAKKEFHEIEFESSFMKEAGILVHLKHPNIVDFICCGNGLEKGDRFIAMELMDMSLFDLIQKHKQKDEHFSILVAIDLMVQVARGVCYLHSQGIAHRDLKPQNVVVSQLNTQQLVDQFCVKLVDFGGSKVEVETSKPNTMTARGTGTTMYRAPEVHPMANPNSNGIGKVNWLKADAFSFAMTCAHLLNLENPFQDLRPSDLYNKVIKDGVRPIVHQMYPEDLVVLLKDCWNTNPRMRPSFVNICRRLERFQHKYLRAHMTLDKGLMEDPIDISEGFDFIKRRLDSPIKNQVGSEVEDEIPHDIVSTISCTCGFALEYLPQPPYACNTAYCDMCHGKIRGEIYHCKICKFDAHLECVEIKDKVEVSFHDHTLHLLLQNYYNDKPQALCHFCEESVQESDWVYRCEQCDFDVHALCTKFPRKFKDGDFHQHLITMRQCSPRKSLPCHCCNGEIREYTWYYTCGLQSCAWNVHPLCTILPWKPPCLFDITHWLQMERKQRSFYCGICKAPGFSWFYHCHKGCNVDIHPDCVEYMDEKKCNWIRAYERFMMENQSKGNHTKMNMLLDLFNTMPIFLVLGASSSSRSRPPSVLMREEPSIQRLTLMDRPSLDASKDVNLQRQIAAQTAERIKAKKMAAKEASQKLQANLLEMLESMERVVLDLQSSENMSQDDAEVLAATLEELKRRQDLVKEQRAMQVQSKMSQGPRIAVFYRWKKEDGKWLRELLTSVRADMELTCWALLCEEPGHEHIFGIKLVFLEPEFGEESAEKVGPLIACGLEVVRKAMSTLDPLKLVGLECIMLPSLDADPVPWDLRAIEHEKHDIESNDLSEDKEKVEALKQAQDSAAEWFRSWSEESGVSMLNDFGLQRVRYKVTEEGDYPKYRRGSLAWLCTDHLDSGLKDGTLERAPLKYYNAEEDDQLRSSCVT